MPRPEPTCPSWYRPRRYLHFDRPVGARHASLTVGSPDKVAEHAFYPLIRYNHISEKVRKASDGSGVERKEKVRPIAYASHIDAHIYSYYAELLSASYEHVLQESDLSACVLAFRSLGASNIDFAANAFEEIRQRHECVAVALDVSGFFDHLDHNVLKKQWCDLLDLNSLPPDHYNIYKSLTKFSYVERRALYEKLSISASNPKRDRRRVCTPSEFRTMVRGSGLIEVNRNRYGIPQGAPISAVLSNIYMMKFDLDLKRYADSVSGIYLRYCDDILLILPISEIGGEERIAREALSQLKLTLNSSKTDVVVFRRSQDGLRSRRPLQYLGFTFDGQRTLIRSAAFARFSNRMKRGVRLAKATNKRWNRIRSRQGAPRKDLYRRKLYMKYSYLGNRNFISYGYRAARIMESEAIRKQLKPLWGRLLAEIDGQDTET